ncbi:Oligopeptide transport system permease protein AppB [Bacillus glycinifermentans]|nr:DUF3603 family protein [Bacillus glycinifermentans]SCA85077.1 Oligopeptide transport system permease protein AppB [Bacillus glycinifermentans]
MVTYIIRRTLMSIPILLGITILSFAIMKAAPGDPMALMMDPTISAADREKFIEKYGLNEPEHIQYLKWLGNMVQGDFGTSIVRKGMPVTELILARLPNTLLLMLVSTILALLISIPFGVLSARRPYSKLDQLKGLKNRAEIAYWYTEWNPYMYEQIKRMTFEEIWDMLFNETIDGWSDKHRDFCENLIKGQPFFEKLWEIENESKVN